MQTDRLKPIIEAALLAASQPLSMSQLCELFGEEDGVDRGQIAIALKHLSEDCQGRGVELKEVASGFRYQVRQGVHPWVSRMWSEKPSRYSRALLETLALIAYRQPITRPEIEQIRGVVVSSNIIKTLEEREWIRVVGHRDVPGKPALYGTTRLFLDYFNLKSLDELPPLSEIRDLEDPQLRLDNEVTPPIPVRELPMDTNAEHAPSETLAHETSAEVFNPNDKLVEAELESSAADQAALDARQERFPASGHVEESSEEAAIPSGEPASDPTAQTDTHPATADEATHPAAATPATAAQDAEEYRA